MYNFDFSAFVWMMYAFLGGIIGLLVSAFLLFFDLPSYLYVVWPIVGGVAGLVTGMITVNDRN